MANGTVGQRPGRRLIGIGACLVVLLAAIVPLGLDALTPQASAAVVISPSDPMLAAPRGTPEKVVRFAQAKQSLRFAETRAYIYEVYRLAPLVGLDPAIVISQSALETANWTSDYWATYLNPAGIGIGYGGASSYTWADGAAAARNHVVRLYIYSAGPIEAGNPLYAYRNDGPTYQRLFDLGYDGQARVLDDLTGKWATDPLYGQKVSSRGSGIYAAATGDPTEPAVSPTGATTSNGADPWRTRDGYLPSSFAVRGGETPPAGAWISYDFGQSVVFQSIQWVFRHADYADEYRLETSTDGKAWTPRGYYGSPTQRTWQIYGGSVTARYVRLIFENPNDDINLGYLSEVEFYGHYLNGVPTATSTVYPRPTATNTPIPTATPKISPTPTPTKTPAVLQGELLATLRSGGSASGNWSGYVRDGKITTTWQTITDSAPSRAQVYVDFGKSGAITGAEFTFRRKSGARSYQIRVSTDKVNWTTVATFNYAEPLVWQRAEFNATGRYVQFLFFNVNNASALGYLAEIRIFGNPESFGSSDAPPPTETPTPISTATAVQSEVAASPVGREQPATEAAIDLPVGSPVNADEIAVTGYRRTANSSSASVLSDGSPDTVWESTASAPDMIYVVAELGSAQPIGEVRLLPGSSGISGLVQIETSLDGIAWEFAGTPISSDTSDWPSLAIGREATAIRIVVTNPDGAATIGGIAEVRVNRGE
jgi:hypothetical protein